MTYHLYFVSALCISGEATETTDRRIVVAFLLEPGNSFFFNIKANDEKMGISQEEIVINAQTVTKGLEALRAEHQSLLSSLKTVATPSDEQADNEANRNEKASLLEKSLEMIDLGLGEAHVMAALASHLQVCSVFSSLL